MVNPYPSNFEPKALVYTIREESNYVSEDRIVIRFDDLYNACYWDHPDHWEKFNITGEPGSLHRETSGEVKSYIQNRFKLNSYKLSVIEKAKKNLQQDPEFLKLIHKAKSDKRSYVKNKFSGNFSPVDFARQEEKVFNRQAPGKKSSTLNLAFQVGTFMDYDYEGSFEKILKTVLMCQSLGVKLNIDVFDSDTTGCGGNPGYIIVNVAKSCNKLNFSELFAFSHKEFFDYTLFNGYLQIKQNSRIGTFLDKETIVNDLGSHYDIIGGNMLTKERDEMVSSIIKIANLHD